MTTLDGNMTVGELVLERPARSRLFEELGIDYCCGGKRSISRACEKKGLDLQHFEELLEAFEETWSEEPMIGVDHMSLTELAQHIVETHHAYLHAELPRLERISQKVAKVHGEQDPRLKEVAIVFGAFQTEIGEHTAKEEQVLFPAIRVLDEADTAPDWPFGTLANPIRCMEAEHDNAGDALERFRALTDGFSPPEWACNTYRALFDGLRYLEQDMHQHIHKENNVLFPRAIEKETQLNSTP